MKIEDVKEQLKEKNKEIYLNKLNLDLTNNSEVLIITLENNLKNIESKTFKIVLSILESFQKQDIIQEYIKEFIKDYKDNLFNLVSNKRYNLEKQIKLTNKIIDYKEIIINENKILKENLNNNFDKLIKELINKINSLLTDEFSKLRINEYLINIYKEKINHNILDTIINRDIILLNTFKESYLKYLELNKNTVEK